MTWTVHTQQSVTFNIELVSNVLDTVQTIGSRTIVVIDSKVNELYGNLISDSVIRYVVVCDESLKNIDTVESILQFFEHNNVLRRSEPIYAIGGGVLLDLVGYACSIYRRGIPYIRVPTTLLAIVDASVGAKTGINHFGRRNRLGSYYPPVKTVIDPKFIVTQDNRQISNGLAEILKLALVLDVSLFSLIEQHYKTLLDNKLQTDPANQVISLSIQGMISELQDNLWERDLKRSVDFGHTFSPIIEMTNVDTMLHGEAVILDCLLSCCLSYNRKIMTETDLNRVFTVVRNCNLSLYHESFNDIELVLSGLRDVTNHRDGSQNIPLVTNIGEHVIVNDVTDLEITKAI